MLPPVIGNDLVGRNVRRIRAERRLTMSGLAAQAGLSKQTLSKIEMGEGNPTVETLEAIAGALRVGVAHLLTEWGSPITVQRAADVRWDEVDGVGVRRLNEIYGSGYVRTFLIRMAAGEGGVEDPGSPGSLMHLYVIAGEVQAGPEGAYVSLSPGDFGRFPADVRHGYRCSGGEATVHVVLTMPQLPQFPAT